MMTITKWIDMGQDVEIEITADDIRVALEESFVEANRATLETCGEVPNSQKLCQTINHIGQFLNALTDEQIALLNESQRRVIERFMRNAAARFMAGGLFKNAQ